MNGIIIVNKEQGFTSHDVVAKLRGILHFKKIGHTGTLDPDATGVLPVCVGKATKVCDLLTDRDKTYVAEVRLGVTTDTLDLTGEILSTAPVGVSEGQLREALGEFTGVIQQIPPMYSAVKVNGKRLYELARQGREVERRARKVVIHRLDLRETALERGEFTIEATCSKGTYIRSLCDDIGKRLGCGAAMKSLVRTGVGGFELKDALTLAEIEQRAAASPAGGEELLLPVDSVFQEYGACYVSAPGLKYLRNGNMVSARLCQYDSPAADGELVRMYDMDGSFYALYRYRKDTGMYQAVKMFH